MKIDPKRLHDFLSYDPATGLFLWKARTPEMFRTGSAKTKEHLCRKFNATLAGSAALNVLTKNGYFVGSIENRQYIAHQVAWAMVSGSWPAQPIDHINGNGSDNRIANLRLATYSQNNMNKASRSKTSSKFKGVSFEQSRGKWLSSIFVEHAGQRKRIFLGRHDTEQSAALAYDNAAKKHFGEFARLNFPDVVQAV